VTVTYALLAALTGVAILMCIWAWGTGGPGRDVNLKPTVEPAKHSAHARGEATQRLRPNPAPLPRKEDMPWWNE
jgi:hypothetical protein